MIIKIKTPLILTFAVFGDLLISSSEGDTIYSKTKVQQVVELVEAVKTNQMSSSIEELILVLNEVQEGSENLLFQNSRIGNF